VDPDRDPAALDGVGASLLARRVVVLGGELDDARATDLAATLLTLDATGDEPITLRLSGCRGALHPSLTVLDVLEVLGVEVHGAALGTIEGGPVGVLAACTVRQVAPHAVLRLREPDVEVAGTATELERLLAANAATRRAFLDALARRTRRPTADVEAEWDRGAYLDAPDAVTLGYADAIAGASRAAGGDR
jgi:ATP-dependent Clp protease protease subunit